MMRFEFMKTIDYQTISSVNVYSILSPMWIISSKTKLSLSFFVDFSIIKEKKINIGFE
jgi:hypothetical protein